MFPLCEVYRAWAERKNTNQQDRHPDVPTSQQDDRVANLFFGDEEKRNSPRGHRKHVGVQLSQTQRLAVHPLQSLHPRVGGAQVGGDYRIAPPQDGQGAVGGRWRTLCGPHSQRGTSGEKPVDFRAHSATRLMWINTFIYFYAFTILCCEKKTNIQQLPWFSSLRPAAPSRDGRSLVVKFSGVDVKDELERSCRVDSLRLAGSTRFDGSRRLGGRTLSLADDEANWGREEFHVSDSTLNTAEPGDRTKANGTPRDSGTVQYKNASSDKCFNKVKSASQRATRSHIHSANN